MVDLLNRHIIGPPKHVNQITPLAAIVFLVQCYQCYLISMIVCHFVLVSPHTPLKTDELIL